MTEHWPKIIAVPPSPCSIRCGVDSTTSVGHREYTIKQEAYYSAMSEIRSMCRESILAGFQGCDIVVHIRLWADSGFIQHLGTCKISGFYRGVVATSEQQGIKLLSWYLTEIEE